MFARRIPLLRIEVDNQAVTFVLSDNLNARAVSVYFKPCFAGGVVLRRLLKFTVHNDFLDVFARTLPAAWGAPNHQNNLPYPYIRMATTGQDRGYSTARRYHANKVVLKPVTHRLRTFTTSSS